MTDSDLCPHCKLPACPTWLNRHPEDDYSLLVARHGTPLPFRRQQHQHGTLIKNMERYEERHRQEALANRQARAQVPQAPVVNTPAWLVDQPSPTMVPAFDENGDPAENSLLDDFKHLCLPAETPIGTIFGLITNVGQIFLEIIDPPPSATHRRGGPAVFVRRIIDDTGPLRLRISRGEVKVVPITKANIYTSSQR